MKILSKSEIMFVQSTCLAFRDSDFKMSEFTPGIHTSMSRAHVTKRNCFHRQVLDNKQPIRLRFGHLLHPEPSTSLKPPLVPQDPAPAKQLDLLSQIQHWDCCRAWLLKPLIQIYQFGPIFPRWDPQLHEFEWIWLQTFQKTLIVSSAHPAHN